MQASPPAYPTTRSFRRCPHCRPSACLDEERNLLSAVVSVGVVVLVCVAVFDLPWFWMEGGGCSRHTLDLSLFFYAGRFAELKPDPYSPSNIPDYTHSPKINRANVYYNNEEELESCVTPHIVSLLQVVIGLAFLMMCAAAVQFMLDLAGPAGKTVQCLRRNALASIVAVCVCVAGVGVCYRLTIIMESFQWDTKPTQGVLITDRVQVKFDIGFYMFVLAGGLSVVAVGCNWLRPAHIFPPDNTPLLEDTHLDGLDTLIGGPGTSPGFPYLMDREPPPPLEGNPPPPYSP